MRCSYKVILVALDVGNEFPFRCFNNQTLGL